MALASLGSVGPAQTHPGRRCRFRGAFSSGYLATRTARRAGDFDLAQEHLRACEQLGFEPKTAELEWALLTAKRGRFAEQEPFLWFLVEQDHPVEAKTRTEGGRGGSGGRGGYGGGRGDRGGYGCGGRRY